MISDLEHIRCESCGTRINIPGVSEGWIRQKAKAKGWVFVQDCDYCPICVSIIKTPFEELMIEGYQGRRYE